MTLLALALRNLTRHRRRTLVTVGALVIGVAAVVAARGFINAQHALMLEGAVNGQLGAVQVHRAGYAAAIDRSPLSYVIDDSPALRAQMAAVEGVAAVAPRIWFGGLLAPVEGEGSWLSVTAIEPPAERMVTPRRFELVGTGRALQGERELWLQADIARGLALAVPSPVDETRWPALLATDRDAAANGEALQLVGTLASSIPGDRRVALVSLAAAQRLLRMPGQVTEYAIAVRSLGEARAVRDRLALRLGPGFEVQTWETLAPLLRELHGYQDMVFGALSALLLAVVLLTAINNLLMNVLERTREIGTLLAIGMRVRQIATLFVLEGLLLGLIGGVVGSMLGAGVVAVCDQLGPTMVLAGTTVSSRLHFAVTPSFLALISGLTAVCTAAAALWPARHAARLAPVAALRAR